MTSRPRFAALIVGSILAGLVAVSCSKASSPTAPNAGGYGGGGGGSGGGGNPAFNLGPFAAGQSASLTFGAAATMGYHCIPHQSMGMVGTVQVDGNGADSVLVRIAVSGLTFTPATAHIRPGGVVRWVNASSSTIHTVTSD